MKKASDRSSRLEKKRLSYDLRSLRFRAGDGLSIRTGEKVVFGRGP